jgi:uncharacterized protein YhaN
MRIRVIEVDRFGPLQNVRRELPPAGLITLFGPNETGKSSLLAMLRGVLYGFPGGRNGTEQGWGGAVEVELADGRRARVERHAPRHFRAVELGSQGREIAADDWQRDWLQSTTEKLFRNVYGFGLEELARLGESLSEAEIDTELASAGLGIDVNLSEVRRKLEQDRDKIWKPGGSVQPLAKTFAAVKSLDQAIRDGQRREGGYHALLAEEGRARDAQNLAADRLAAARAKAVRLEHLAQLWPHWRRYQEIQAEKAAVADGAEVPLEAAPEVDRLLQELDVMARAREDLVADLARAEAELPSASLRETMDRPDWPALMAAVQEALRAAEDHGRAVEVSRERRAEVDMMARSLGLAPELLMEGLPIDVWRERLRAEDDDIREEEAQIRNLDQGAATLEMRTRDHRDELDSLGDIPGRLQWETRIQELEELSNQAFPPPWPLWLFLAGALGVGAGLLSQHPLSLALGVLAGVAAVGGLVGAVNAARRARQQALTRLEVPGPGDIVAELMRLRALEQQVREKDELVQQLSQVERQLYSYRGEADLHRERRRDLLRQSEAWRSEAGLPSMERDQLGGWLDRVRDGSLAAARWREADRQIQEAVAKLDAFQLQAAAVAAELHLELPEPDSLDTWVGIREQWRAWPGIRHRWEVAAERLKTHDAQSQERQQALAMWMERLHAGSVPALQERLGRQARYRALVAEEAQETAILSVGADSFGAARVEYEQYWPEGPQVALAEARASVETADATWQAAVEHLSAAHHQRESLERSGDLALLRIERAAKLCQAEREAAEWGARTMALLALDEAVGRYQAERQPLVLQEASELFRQVTRGRWVRVFQPLDGSGLQVEQAHDGPLDASRLSRGAREQLYLALRLAWIAERARRGQTLPLILDDILVNSDAARQEALASMLTGFARNFQVIYLTCHGETVERLRAAGAEAEVVLAG